MGLSTIFLSYLYITGPANCGKTFILDCLQVSNKTLVSPATCSYAWLGMEETEVIFLNDFYYTPAILLGMTRSCCWKVTSSTLLCPQLHMLKTSKLQCNTPVYATLKPFIVVIKGTIIDERETEMMDVGWRKYHFFHQIPISSQTTVTPCGFCFARFLLDAD